MKRIKTEMTSKERLTAYQKGEEVDRIPVTLTASETVRCCMGFRSADAIFQWMIWWKWKPGLRRILESIIWEWAWVFGLCRRHWDVS